ncbi:helix-turn-helix transcriptional regulator [Streptomyces nondiastaticus]|uniref:Helix-turn-helix transcriptional regulator n=1 Tax=Streptomyces nondiastaticus TaxID=3154512 RepID=A0ABW6UAG5_9ACTN
MHCTENMSDVVAEQIRRHRTRLGINREQLAEECARLGAPELTYAAITNIETGRRDKAGKRRREVTIDELMTFAYALSVPPLLLMLPLGSVDAVPSPARWGGQHPRTLWKWATGEEPPTFLGPEGRPVADDSKIADDDNLDRFEVWQQVSLPTEVYRSHDAALNALKKASGRHDFAVERHGADAKQTRQARQEYLDALSGLAGALNEMSTLGLRLSAYSRKWVDDMKRFELLDRPEAVKVFEPGSRVGEA